MVLGFKDNVIINCYDVYIVYIMYIIVNMMSNN